MYRLFIRMFMRILRKIGEYIQTRYPFPTSPSLVSTNTVKLRTYYCDTRSYIIGERKEIQTSGDAHAARVKNERAYAAREPVVNLRANSRPLSPPAKPKAAVAKSQRGGGTCRTSSSSASSLRYAALRCAALRCAAHTAGGGARRGFHKCRRNVEESIRDALTRMQRAARRRRVEFNP